MQALTVPELLQVWENGIAQDPVDRALSLLARACPETPRDALAKLSIGQRDYRLLTLREWTFGPRLESIVNCKQCGQRVELQFEVASVRADVEPALTETVALASGGCELQVRPPNSEDISALAVEPAVEKRRQMLFRRCLLSATRDGEPTTADQLPPEAMDIVSERLAEADPQADVQLEIACPFCGKGWRAPFDILSFFWNEIEAWACRMLHEVHTLASAYGWSERDVMALSPVRRQLYLEMVSA